ncbi:MAG: pantetheine-phosphate adenylyltransferase [Rhodospirillaceae bacterium]|nr:pantetheine-phosphate adenylyltransferase [Rhodospirillaceae bacterium]|tara:strand:+ start:53288 stop:53791 length:504 start_codon:yes stop_codon:yes gene_type:complete
MTDQLIGIYPGTFDPITNGHTDVIQRAARMLDKLVVGVAINAGKGPLFSLEERLEMVRVEADEMGDVGNRIEVCGFNNLLVDFAKENNASVIIRGLRAVSDFDYEFQMASMNAKLAPDVETVCLMASDRHQFIASRLVKEIAILGGDVAQFVSPRVRELLEAKVKDR